MKPKESKADEINSRTGNRRMKAVGLSIDPAMFEQAKLKAEKLGFRHSFSAYVQQLIQRDLAKK